MRADVGDAVSIMMEPVTAQKLGRHPSLAVPIRWILPSGVERERIAALVPLPSVWMTIENHGAGTVRFGCASFALTSPDGRSWPVVFDRAEVERLAVERLVAEEGTLAAVSPEALRKAADRVERDPMTPHPITVVREAFARARIFDPTVAVEPGGRWEGAVVFDLSPLDVASLEQLVGGARLDLRIACAQTDDAPLAAATFKFRLEPTGASDVCIEERTSSRGYGRWGGSTPSPKMAGHRVSTTDVDDALIAQPASRAPAEKAAALRGWGVAAIAVGVLGSVVTAAVLGSSGHAEEAPAALSGLSLSVAGGIMTYFGHRQHKEAVNRYNLRAAATGICATPN